jgi:hypothetical protein
LPSKHFKSKESLILVNNDLFLGVILLTEGDEESGSGDVEFWVD